MFNNQPGKVDNLALEQLRSGTRPIPGRIISFPFSQAFVYFDKQEKRSFALFLLVRCMRFSMAGWYTYPGFFLQARTASDEVRAIEMTRPRISAISQRTFFLDNFKRSCKVTTQFVTQNCGFYLFGQKN